MTSISFKRYINGIVIWFVKFIGLLILGLVAVVIIYSVKNKLLYNHIYQSALAEFNSIQLPDELKNGSDSSPSPLGCSYDSKVGTTRCTTNLDKYYATNADPLDEIIKINDYVTRLGWVPNNLYDDTMEEMIAKKNKGILPSKKYEKHIDNGKYKLEMYIHFYREKDRSKFDSEYDRKINRIIDSYVSKYKSVYNIHISSDMIER